jgi:hypothetical protein
MDTDGLPGLLDDHVGEAVGEPVEHVGVRRLGSRPSPVWTPPSITQAGPSGSPGST